MSVACTRVTTGMTCDVDTCSMGAGTCGAGRCMGSSYCGGDCTCNNNVPNGTCVDTTPPISLCAIAIE